VWTGDSVQNLLFYNLLSENIRIRIYKTIILSVVLYGCKTWSLTLREEHRLRVFENRVMGRDEVTGGWRKLHNEELRNILFTKYTIIKMMKWRRMRFAGHVT
jgi:hypothetical protein